MSALKRWNHLLGLPELDENGDLRDRPPGYSKVHAFGALVQPRGDQLDYFCPEDKNVWENRFVWFFGVLYALFMVAFYVGLPLTLLIWIF